MIQASPIGRVVPLATAATLWWCAGAAGQMLGTVVVASGLDRSIGCKAPPDDSSRLFIVEKRGVIKILELPDHTLRPTPFLDIDSRVVNITGNNDERGLLGLVFHPDYAVNGRFFVNYINNNGATVIAEYSVTGDPNIADFGSESILRTIGQPEQNHNGGCLQFGPDGMLYTGMGDGGGAGDQHGAFGNAQALNTLLGKMLRLDVDAGAPYIPGDNPFVGAGDPLDEIWAYGLRNPWRFSFDGKTGDMYIGDVGQNAWEEIDFQPSSSTGGENYAWRCMEGNSCFNADAGPNCTCNDPGLADPIHVYSLTGGRCTVIGGYVYRGNVLTSEVGKYFFGDFCSGQTWTFKVVGGNVTELTERTSELGSMGGMTSFCEDAAGELYIVRQSPAQVVKIISTDPCAGCDDGFFCNGSETCVAKCLPGEDPCPGQLCRESDDQCVECLSVADCSDELLCTTDSCDSVGACVFTPVACPPGEQCDPLSGACVSDCSNDAECPAGQHCDTNAHLCKDCLNDTHCANRLVCDPGPGLCLECLNDDHCGPDIVCTSEQVCAVCEFDSQCNDDHACTDDSCESGVCENLEIFCSPPAQCDPADGVCKECIDDEACAAGEICDLQEFVCRPGCRNDSDCKGGMRCDSAEGACKECLSSDDCADDGLFCNGAMVCTNGTCHAGPEPCLDQKCDEKQDVCVSIGNAALGGLLYDNWVTALGVAAPQTDHPLWQFRPDQNSNSRTGAATWRCKECHGWDYKGVDGQYGSGSHRTGISGILGTSLSTVDLVTLLTESPSSQRGSSVPNGHSYGTVLTESQINDVVAFVLDGGTVDYDAYINPTGEIEGDPVQGQVNYMTGGCVSCHGTDGTQRNFGTAENPEWVATVATDNPWEFFHKVRFGQPGSLPQMPAWSVGGGAIGGIADLGRYVQGNFPVDCIDESQCGGNTPCGQNVCADGRCGFNQRMYGDLVGFEGVCGPNGNIDLSDILAVLDGFEGRFPEGCGLDDFNIAGESGSCVPDDTISLFDIVAVLNAFQGADPCCQ